MRTLVLVLGLVATLTACSHPFPETLPATSAASIAADDAPAARVGRALREHPPLPGEPTDGWEALDHTTGGGHPHAH